LLVICLLKRQCRVLSPIKKTALKSQVSVRARFEERKKRRSVYDNARVCELHVNNK